MPITPQSDKTITRQVQSRLVSRGLRAPCRIVAETIKGVVTLTGSVPTLQLKGTAVQVVTGITGVRQVVDRLTIKVAVKY